MPIWCSSRPITGARLPISVPAVVPAMAVPQAPTGTGNSIALHQFQPLGDVVHLGLQQLVAEGLWCALQRPGRSARLIGAQQHAFALLAEIHIAFVVDASGQAFVAALRTWPERGVPPSPAALPMR